MSTDDHLQHFKNIFRRFFHENELTEVRAFGLSGRSSVWSGFAGGSGIVSGYFSNAADFGEAAAKLDEAGATGTYFCINPVDNKLLARAENRLKASPKNTTTDRDITVVRWLFLDIDVVRPSGISSSDSELKRAVQVGREICLWLEGKRGFPKAYRAMSGNGVHLLFRLDDLPNNPENQEAVKKALWAVSSRFSCAGVEIDLAVFNPSRIIRVPFTHARKGDNTKERPHRRSYLFQDQPETLAEIGIVPIEDLKKLAALAPDRNETHHNERAIRNRTQGRKSKSDLGPLDVEKYLTYYGIAFNKKAGPEGITIYRLERCLFDPNHGRNEAAINQASDGTLTYQCFHNSCKGRTWREAREIISGDDNLAPFCEGFDPNWKSTKKRPLTTSNGRDNGDSAGYLVENEKGRVKFVPALMADYLQKQLDPLIYEGNEFSKQFYKYHQSGVWKPFPRDAIRLIVRNLLGDHAKAAWIDGAIDVLGAQVFKMPEELEFNPMLLNLRNGMLDIERMELKPHAPEYNSRVQLPVAYKEDATCPRWIETVAQIFADDLKKGDVLQQFFGYCLYAKILFPCAIFAIGSGANAKGLTERILCSMLGRENVSHISLGRMEEPFGVSEIQGKLLNSIGETEHRPLEVTRFKQISAGDEVQAQRKYLSDITFRPIAKHWISMNFFPGIREKTNAFFRRIIVLEYKQKFEGSNDDKRLADKLMEELDGIFCWSLDGLRRVLEREEIVIPETVELARQRFREKTNPVLAFAKEVCLVSDDTSDKGPRVLPADLYRGYTQWMDEAKLKSLGKQNFYEQIYLNFPYVRKRRYGSREYFFGIGLRVNE